MTDETRDKQLIADIAAISNSLPQIPSSYGELRALIAALPNPTLPDIRSARSGAADSLAVSSFGGPSSPLSGQPIGQESGGSIGIESLLTFGQGNVLSDPTIEQASSGSSIAIGTAVTTVGQWWRAQYVLNSGTAPAGLNFLLGATRYQNAAVNPFSSAEAEIRVDAAAATTNFDVYLWPVIRPNGSDYAPGTTNVPILPYLIAGAKVRRKGYLALPAGYTVTLRMQLLRVTDSVVVGESTPIDYGSLVDFDEIRFLWTAVAQTFTQWTTNTYRWRLKISIVNTGVIDSDQNHITVGVGEPLLQWSYTANLPPYSPYIGAWIPNRLESRQQESGTTIIGSSLRGDSTTSGIHRLEILANGDINWGSGAANADARLRRSAAKTLMLDDGIGTSLTALDLKGPLLRFGGTAFPAGPVDGDLFYRTDLNLWFFYNGTRWLSTTLYHYVIPHSQRVLQSISATISANYLAAVPPFGGGSDLWIEDAQLGFQVAGGGTALGTSHKWVVTLAKAADGGTAETTFATFNIDSGASAAWRGLTVVVDALLNNGTTHRVFSGANTKTGTPGALFATLTLSYRIVAT